MSLEFWVVQELLSSSVESADKMFVLVHLNMLLKWSGIIEWLVSVINISLILWIIANIAYKIILITEEGQLGEENWRMVWIFTSNLTFNKIDQMWNSIGSKVTKQY